MTAGHDDVWRNRRRQGETLRRWATPERASATPQSAPPGRPDRRHAFRVPAHRTAVYLRAHRTALRLRACWTALRVRACWTALRLRACRPRIPAPWSASGRWARRRALCPAPKDGGAATIFVLAVGLVIVLMGVAGAGVGAARIGRHRAQAAADLGALAGAPRAVEGTVAACERAGRFAAVNGGRATSCEVNGLEIVVRTEVIVTPLPGLTRRATAAARAGPIYAPAS